MAIDPKKNVRVLTTLRRDQLPRIEKFKSEQRLKSRDEAIRQMIDIGAKHAPPPKKDEES
jgi:hypothetical protein